MVKDMLEEYRCFWNRENNSRPLFGCNIGFFVNQRFPNTMKTIHNGLVKPDDIHIDLFLEDCDNLYQEYKEINDDYPYVEAAFSYIPWMEAIMGCSIKFSDTSFWAEPCITNLENLDWKCFDSDNPWLQKLLELMKALVKHSDERYQVAPTLMRGPSDMLAAMLGAGQLPVALIDFPDLVKHAIDVCADVWIKVGKAQLSLILVIWRLYEDGFWVWLDRVLTELPYRGLSIQVTVKDVEKGKKIKAKFFEVISRIQQEMK